MTDYTKLTNFSVKDTLASGNPAKVIRGAEFDAEFNNIQIAVNAKADEAELATETQARQAADQALQDSLNTEETARISADNTLQSNIDAEASARQSADTTLQGNIDAEASARQSADTTLQGNIDLKADIDSPVFTGNVGVNTVNPSATLDVAGTLQGGSSNAVNGQTILTGNYVGNNKLNVIGSNGSEGGTVIGFSVKPKGLGTSDSFVSSVGNVEVDRSSYIVGANHRWFTQGFRSLTPIDSDVSMTERMRLTSSGYLKADPSGSYIEPQSGTSGVSQPWHQFNSNSSDNVVAVTAGNSTNNYYSGHPASASGGAHFTGRLGSTITYQVLSNGTVSNVNGVIAAGSDIKLKENITDATPKLDDITAIRFVNFDLKDNPELGKQFGVIAQEIEEVFPNLVINTPDTEEVETTDEEGNTVTETVETGTVTKSVKYSVLTLMAVKALQELKTEKDELAVEHESLKDQVRLLTERIEAIEANN